MPTLISDPIKYDLSVRVVHKTLGVTAPFHGAEINSHIF